MFELAGQLGVDPYLLLAQGINFGILLWILTQFVYEPIVDEIEQQKEDMEEARRMKEQLEEEREEFQKTRENKLEDARQKSREIIEEAKSIAEDIKDEAREQAEETRDKLRRQAERQVESERESQQERITNSLRNDIENRVRSFIDESVSKDGGGLEEALFGELADRLREQPDEVFQRTDLPVQFSYYPDATEEQQETLRSIIDERGGDVSHWECESDVNLIDGFRLEIGGVSLESSMAQIIEQAMSEPPAPEETGEDGDSQSSPEESVS